MAWCPQQRSKQLSLKSNQEESTSELKNEFLREFQRVQKLVHHFIDDLTAISGYAQIVQLKPERSAAELHKIIHTVEKCMQMLRGCMDSLKELERKYS